jgi:hypothetical protein
MVNEDTIKRCLLPLLYFLKILMWFYPPSPLGVLFVFGNGNYIEMAKKKVLKLTKYEFHNFMNS